MNSFYGGKQGRTYDIIERYDSVSDMLNHFRDGGAYTDVNYGEYVLIDTIKNNRTSGAQNPENGLLFRRGFDYNTEGLEQPNKQDYYIEIQDQQSGQTYHQLDEQSWNIAWSNWLENVGHGAIYVGQIVGSDGPAPEVRLAHWEDLQVEQNSIIQPASQTEAVQWDENKQEYVYHNKISVKSDLIRKETENENQLGDIIGVRIAFDFPNPIIKVSAQSVSPYDTYNKNTDTHNNLGEDRDHYDEFTNVGNHESTGAFSAEYNKDTKQWKYSNLIHEHSKSGHSSGHQFYHNYDIAIPKGIHGNTIESITTKPGYAIDIDLPSTTTADLATESLSANDSNNDPIVSGDEYITFDLRNYDESEEGAITANQGRFPYRVINTISANLTNRTYFTFGTPHIGDVYKYIGTNNGLYAICINEGRSYEQAVLETLENLNINPPTGWSEKTDIEKRNYAIQEYETIKSSSNIALDNIITDSGKFSANNLFKPNEVNHAGQYLGNLTQSTDPDNQNRYQSKWRVISIPQQAPPRVFDIDYRAGATEHINGLRFVDYMYLDDNGKLHAVYVDKTITDNQSLTPEAKKGLLDQEIGFIDFIQSIGYKDGVFTFNMLSGDKKDFNVNAIIDVKQIGDNICVLYSSAAYRNNLKKKYDDEQGGLDKAKNIKYFIETYQKEQGNGITTITAPYFVINAISGKYHLFGKVSLLDLIDLSPLQQQYQDFEFDITEAIENEIIAELEIEEDNWNNFTEEEKEDKINQKYAERVFTKGWLVDGFDPNENPSSVGWVVTCENGDNIQHYAFDWNTTTPQQDQISYDINSLIENNYDSIRLPQHQNDVEWDWPIFEEDPQTGEIIVTQQEGQRINKIIKYYTPIVLQKLIIYSNSEYPKPHFIYINTIPNLDNSEQSLVINKWFDTRWYVAQVITSLDINATSLYRIQDQDSFKISDPFNEIQSGQLNNDGLWFVLQSGKDKEE